MELSTHVRKAMIRTVHVECHVLVACSSQCPVERQKRSVYGHVFVIPTTHQQYLPISQSLDVFQEPVCGLPIRQLLERSVDVEADRASRRS